MNTTLIRKGNTINGITLRVGITGGPNSVKAAAECAIKGHEWYRPPGASASNTGQLCRRCGTAIA